MIVCDNCGDKYHLHDKEGKYYDINIEYEEFHCDKCEPWLGTFSLLIPVVSIHLLKLFWIFHFLLCGLDFALFQILCTPTKWDEADLMTFGHCQKDVKRVHTWQGVRTDKIEISGLIFMLSLLFDVCNRMHRQYHTCHWFDACKK